MHDLSDQTSIPVPPKYISGKVIVTVIGGVIMAGVIGWFSWVTSSLAVGGRFTANDGRSHDTRIYQLETWRAGVRIPPPEVTEAIVSLRTEQTSIRSDMSRLDRTMSKIETDVSWIRRAIENPHQKREPQ